MFTIFFSKDTVQENEKYVQTESNHRLNSWLVSIEDILSSFNLKEEQRCTLKKLLTK